jgi:hypothetical protein
LGRIVIFIFSKLCATERSSWAFPSFFPATMKRPPGSFFFNSVRVNFNAGSVMPSNTDIPIPHTKTSSRWKPFPWSRFSSDDFPREQPLPLCPSQKCCRAKACLAAHKGLFCQRTHFVRAEGLVRTPKSEMDQYIAKIPAPPPSKDNDLRIAYIAEIAGLRTAEQREKMKLWRAGAFGNVYGPYHSKGIMKLPPPRVYVEE